MNSGFINETIINTGVIANKSFNAFDLLIVKYREKDERTEQARNAGWFKNIQRTIAPIKNMKFIRGLYVPNLTSCFILFTHPIASYVLTKALTCITPND